MPQSLGRGRVKSRPTLLDSYTWKEHLNNIQVFKLQCCCVSSSSHFLFSMKLNWKRNSSSKLYTYTSGSRDGNVYFVRVTGRNHHDEILSVEGNEELFRKRVRPEVVEIVASTASSKSVEIVSVLF
ncbi:unnamed protein product [Allacma fusca]|uniref:Uncharacterized protein n=1 Tax=Allacma fusca TaxID=39272 RepID=A0A8J2KQ85_9HEXA|nr:unnamed protein product [Allacma fusca]